MAYFNSLILQPALRLVTCIVIIVLQQQETLATTVIDSNGSFNRRATPIPVSSEGVIAIISSPNDVEDSFTPLSLASDDDDTSSISVCANVDSDSGCIVVSSPGATLSSSNSCGAVASSSVAGSIVMTGVTSSDCVGIMDTRHGKTLSSIFTSRLLLDEGRTLSRDKTLLILAVEGNAEQEDELISDISTIFDACAMESSGNSDASIDDLFEVQILSIDSSEDAAVVIATAIAAGGRSPLAQTSESIDIVSAINEAYTKASSIISSTTTTTTDGTPSISQTFLLCDESFTRQTRTIRAKLTAWKNRVDRSLPVEGFGFQATSLLQRTINTFDRETLLAAGSDYDGGALASYRLDLRSKLQSRMEKGIRDLFSSQVNALEKTTLKKFNSILLRQRNTKKVDVDQGAGGIQDNAEAVRSVTYTFETAMDDLEVPSLSLTKGIYVQKMAGQLNDALLAFPESAAVKLKDMKTVKRMAAKQKKPTERSIDAGLGLVAMIRPDGFGNIQGFAGYTMGSNSVTVGVHNDADAPETISQFGGSRPPFLRIQPKLNLDIEL